MRQNWDAVGYNLNRREDMNGLQKQVVLLSDLSKKLDDYFALPRMKMEDDDCSTNG